MHTDEAKVSQVLRNLLSNALKYTERGEVRVGALVDPDGARITFTVSDTGIGIAPRDQSLIFEEFAQLEHRLQRQFKGTGLGLPLSRRLAELLGGTLTVVSDPRCWFDVLVDHPDHLSLAGPAGAEDRVDTGSVAAAAARD